MCHTSYETCECHTCKRDLCASHIYTGHIRVTQIRDVRVSLMSTTRVCVTHYTRRVCVTHFTRHVCVARVNEARVCGHTSYETCKYHTCNRDECVSLI